jgi:predicted ATP-binding protein involved in virulence
MTLLQELLEATRSAAIIATHSAYVVREVPRQRVRVLNLVGREITIETPRLQTFGASVDQISDFVFGDTSRHHRFQHRLEDWVAREGRQMGLEAITARFGHQLNTETLAYIADLLRRPEPDGAGQ